MRSIVLSVCAWVLSSCALPFIGNKSPLIRPPHLTVDFDSASASAVLVWDVCPQRGFRQYHVQRSRVGREFQTVAVVAGRRDTTYRDVGLLANTNYRYRVVAEHASSSAGSEGKDLVPGVAVSGGIHQLANEWPLPDGFLPTRIAFDRYGILNVVGAGAGWVERFDRGGNSIGQWSFSDQPNGCLETGTLDGPAIAVDGGGNLYVTYNLLPVEGAPQPMWSKFDEAGSLVWRRPLEAAFARHIAIDEGNVFIESISQLQQFDTDGTRMLQYHVPALLVSSLRFWRGYFAALVEPLDFSEIGWRAPRLVLYKSAAREEIDLVLGRDPLSDDDRGAGLLVRPTDFAIHPDENRIFVVNAGQGRIEVFDNGNYLTRWAPSSTDEPTFLFAGTTTVITDLDNGKTKVRKVVAGGIAIDADGYIYVADTFKNRIQKFQP